MSANPTYMYFLDCSFYMEFMASADGRDFKRRWIFKYHAKKIQATADSGPFSGSRALCTMLASSLAPGLICISLEQKLTFLITALQRYYYSLS